MATLDDIIEWAGTLPQWLADAVRRHLSFSEAGLTDKDFEEVLAMANAALKLTDEPSPCLPILPTAEMFSGTQQPVTASITLDAVQNVRHVNAIKAGQGVPFSRTGVTVVYGSNGAGKSGYARILKLACRARDKQERILPNVFSSDAVGPASATIQVTVDGVPTPIDWVQGKSSDPLLVQVTVFDARCARVIVDERNDVTYLPYGADVFERVAQTCIKVRAAIEAKIVATEALQDSGVLGGSASATFLANLSHSTSIEAIDKATEWSPADDQGLAAAEELIRTCDSNKLTTEIARLGRIRGQVQSAREVIANIEQALTALTEEIAQQLYRDLVVAQGAYDIAVAEREIKEPLPGSACTSEWELLYNAAKEYSAIAYPDTSFPNTANESRCVLCQQLLEEEAKERFERFNRFISDKTAETLRQAKAAIVSLANKYENLKPWNGAALELICEEIAILSETASDSVRAYHNSVSVRQESVLATLRMECQRAQKFQWPKIAPNPVVLIDEALQSLDAHIGEMQSAEKPEELRNLIAKRDGLKSRKALHARKADIASHVERLKRNDSLKTAAESIRTTEITKHGTALIRKSLTPALLAALKAEMFELGASRIPLSVKPIGVSGETVHEMLLEGAGMKAKISQVLSEGEQRVIAIAGFLAELEIAGHTNPIVLDDPVSSLDHGFTQRIAARLAREGLRRQVIIFSHDIAFLMELQDAAADLRKAGTPVAIAVQTVRRQGVDAGVGTEGLPWHAQKVSERIQSLEAILHGIESLHASDTDKYNDEAARLYGLLREAWEACIEDDLLYAVVCRYRNSVKTMQLDQVAVEDSDVHTIDRHMSRCSTWMTGHDKSKALSVNRPTPSEIRVDLNHLREASRLFRGRREALRKRRGAQTSATPQAGVTASKVI